MGKSRHWLRRWGPSGILLALSAWAQMAECVTTKFWVMNEEKSLREGKLAGVTISDSGTLKLAPCISKLATLPEPVVWSVAEVSKGTIWLGTGHDGKVFSLAKDGEPEELVKLEDVEVLSLIPDGEGGAWAGTGPNGLIYRIAKDQTATQLFDAPESYVWDLAMVGEALYAAVGPPGKIYRINAKGEATPVLESEEAHILSLSPEPDGSFLVGTEGKGLALSVVPGQPVRVITDPPENEVRGVVAGPRGGFFVAGFSGQGPVVRAPEEKKEGEGEGGENKPEERPDIPAPRGKGSLYWKSSDGDVLSLFEVPNLLCLGRLSGDESVFAGTAERGRLYQAFSDGHWEIASELESSSILRIVSRASGGGYIAAASPCAVYEATGGLVSSGSFTSPTLDAGLEANWGRAEVRCERQGGASIRMATRSGNTKDPDSTWSPWTAPDSVADPQGVKSPPARFLQYRMDMECKEDKPSPEVLEVRIAYVQSNAMPRVTDFVLTKGTEVKDPNKKPEGVVPGGGALAGQVTVSWKVSDENGDKLAYCLLYLREGDSHWWKLAGDLEGESWIWDTTSWEDGQYSLRLEASDEWSNAPGEAKKGERSIPSVVVDNTPPVLDDLKVSAGDSGRILKGRAKDGLTPIANLEWCLDAQKWRKALPVDRLFDDSEEVFEFPLPDLSDGEHTVAVKVADSAGNTQVERLVFQK